MADSLTDRFLLSQMQKSLQDRNGKTIRLRWNTATQVRRSLARVNNLLLNNGLTSKQANAIFFGANLVLKALELEQQSDKK